MARIALDVHGGDTGVATNVAAALDKTLSPDIELVLVGHELQIDAELRDLGPVSDRLRVVHAEEAIGMSESASRSVRRKTDNSISVALDLMRRGEVDAVVSTGHSGALVAASLMVLGRIPGVSRPALGTQIPAKGTTAFVLDIGAFTDPRPEVMLQHGYLGVAYVASILGIERPTVALLSNGEEPGKGDALTRAARELFEASDLHFVGYVEGHEMLTSPPHVTVTDGFTGNVALKIAEGTASYVARLLRDELTATVRTKVLAAMLRPTFRALRRQIDFDGIGGAPLLGVDGIVIAAHGRSTPRALVAAIETANSAARIELTARLREALPAPTRTAIDRTALAAALPS